MLFRFVGSDRLKGQDVQVEKWLNKCNAVGGLVGVQLEVNRPQWRVQDQEFIGFNLWPTGPRYELRQHFTLPSNNLKQCLRQIMCLSRFCYLMMLPKNYFASRIRRKHAFMPYLRQSSSSSGFRALRTFVRAGLKCFLPLRNSAGSIFFSSAAIVRALRPDSSFCLPCSVYWWLKGIVA